MLINTALDLTRLILTTEEETEAWMGKVACPRCSANKEKEPGSEALLSTAQVTQKGLVWMVTVWNAVIWQGNRQVQSKDVSGMRGGDKTGSGSGDLQP